MNPIKKLQKKLSELFIDAFLVLDETNMKYLTDFNLTAGDGCVLVTPKITYIITDARFEAALSEFELPNIQAIITRDYFGAVADLSAKLQIEAVGIEDTITLRDYDILVDQVDADIDSFENIVESLRAVKSPLEIEKLTVSAELNSAGFEYLIKNIKVGMTEFDAANLLDSWMKAHGAQKASFETIVASGINSAKPHATASHKIIEHGDLVVIDFGYFVDGYTADITRTVVMGEIDAELNLIYQTVYQALNAVTALAKDNIDGADLDDTGRNIIEAAGYGKNFNHGMGHGIGMSVHELPTSYGPNSKIKLKQQQVVTVEPGIYLSGKGGVRIEDDILITENGNRVLTTASKELIIL